MVSRVSPACVEVFAVVDQRHLQWAFDVRQEVFVVEQGVPLSEELDDLDHAQTTTHVVAVTAQSLELGRALGTARLLVDAPGSVHIGRVAVRKEARGQGIGALLMTALERVALRNHHDERGVTVALSAQETALPFYESLGYTLVDERRYLDCDIWHRDMAHDLFLDESR